MFSCSVNVFGLVAANVGPTEQRNNAGLVPLCPPDPTRAQPSHRAASWHHTRSARRAPNCSVCLVTRENRATHGFFSTIAW